MANPRATITAIDPAGRGLGLTEDGARVSLAGVLPGERAVIRASALEAGSHRSSTRVNADDLLGIENPSASRVTPPCPHFGTCGGCTLQHWDAAATRRWKHGRIVHALQKAGFDAPNVGDVVAIAPGQRRRMDLAASRVGANLSLGLHAQGSLDIVQLSVCAALHPALPALFAPLAALLRGLSSFRAVASVIANVLDTGVDIVLRLDGPVTADDRKRLAAFALANTVARISLDHGRGKPAEILVNNGACIVNFAGTSVAVPPGAFLQASIAGQNAITAAILAGMPAKLPARPVVAELYAGVGTFSFALAGVARVRAFEGDPAACAAISRAAAGGRIDVTCRDLVRQPLQAVDLKGATAIVLDPPWDGAGPQMAAIAASGVANVIYISCNPQALARDVAVLAQAGYTLHSATPVDQFPWTAEIEAVVVLRRVISIKAERQQSRLALARVGT